MKREYLNRLFSIQSRLGIHLHSYFKNHPRGTLGWAVAGMLLIAALDYVSGFELSFFLFYIGPISLAAWYCGALAGYSIALISSLLWLVADHAAGHIYTEAWISYWNSVIRLILFFILAQLLRKFKLVLAHETALAETDPLTGLLNRRSFKNHLEIEATRAARYGEPFTLAYFDLDNFKQVNDTLGHDAGDELLKCVAIILQGHTRASDYLARLGGDEFAVLLPVAPPESAKEALSKLRTELLSAMTAHDWPVTFSIGALSISHGPGSVEDLLRETDALMYQVKRSGKNNLLHETH